MIVKKVNFLHSESGDPEDDIFEQLIFLEIALKKMKFYEIEDTNPQFSLAMNCFEEHFIKLCSFIDFDIDMEKRYEIFKK